MKRVRVGAVDVAYRHAGDGPPLVLLHGFMHDSRGWRWQLDDLSDAFSVWAWDAPGGGQSSEPPKTWRMPEYADCLAAWMEAVGLRQPHVLGLSWGASLALELYRRHADIPASLILVGAYAGWAGSLPPDVVAKRLDGFLRVADLPPDRVIADFLPTLLPPSASTTLVDEVRRILYDNAAVFHPVGYRAMIRGMAEADLRDILGEISVPTLLVYGQDDTRSPLEIANELRVRIPTAELVVMPGVGHLSNAEAPAAFNAHIRRFLHSLG